MTVDHDPSVLSNAASPGDRFAGSPIRLATWVIDSWILWALFVAVAFVVPRFVVDLRGSYTGPLILRLRVRDPSGLKNPSLTAVVIRNSMQRILPTLAGVASFGLGHNNIGAYDCGGRRGGDSDE